MNTGQPGAPFRFKVGERVLCRYDGNSDTAPYRWVPGTITVVGYAGADAGAAEPSGVIPYQAMIEDPTFGSFTIDVPEDDDSVCCVLNAETCLARRVSNGLPRTEKAAKVQEKIRQRKGRRGRSCDRGKNHEVKAIEEGNHWSDLCESWAKDAKNLTDVEEALKQAEQGVIRSQLQIAHGE